ncbi:MAG: hypothetical protein H3C48_11510, partial [Chitinophagaceae bacterium]|nr:hypothetical protein [Chitinophagaceae bacterium]
LHSAQNKDASIYLTAGVYPIAITFFQKGGGAEMGISWQKTSGLGQFGWGTIPDSVFVDQSSPPAGSVPAKPSGLTATAVSYKKINLSWSDNSNNEQSYEVYRSTDPMGSFTTIAALPANTTSYADTIVEPATTYYYKIRAINQYGESSFDRIGQGLEYAYYEKDNMSVVPDFNLLTPKKTGRVSTFGLGMQMRPDDFALKFDGSININSSGSYMFYLDSDDGSLLYIDGALVVNNDGLHGSGGANEKSGTVFLSAGSHIIQVSYFERGGSEVLNVKYGSSGLGITKQFIPASILGESFASATTLSAPVPPLPPSGMTAVALSNSAIKVSWVNNAENATEVELYRSYNGDHDYVLFAKLPANTTSYNDNGLYPSSLFYYKVRSVGEGGSSLFSNEVNVRTLGVVPSMIPIEDVYIRYDAQVQLKVEAKSGTPVAITLQATNLPAFATFNQTQNGKGVITFNPTISDIGIYKNLKVTASNPQGNSNTTQFDLIVNENYPPHITPVANATVEEMGTLVVNLSATDSDPGDDLRWTFSKLPGFVTASSTNGGSLSLTFAPKNKTAGEYLIKVGVDDGRHGKDTTSFVLTVTPMPITNPDDGTVPIKPNNFTATFVNSLNGVKLEWTNAAYNAVKNEIYRSDYMGTGYVLLKEIAKDDTSYVDNSVVGNKVYYYLIRAVNANGGSNSLIVKVNIPNRAPFIIVDDIYAKAGTTLSVNVLATD